MEVERIAEGRQKHRRQTEYLLEKRILEVTEAKRRVVNEHAQVLTRRFFFFLFASP